MNVAALLEHHEVSQFIYAEARLQDDHEYSEWEKLWADDGVYWIPANGEDIDPERQMSIIYDNRSRISLRVAQLYTGKRHSQLPRSRLRRVISNVELAGQQDGCITATASAVVFEANTRGDNLWGAKLEYRLRRTEGALRMVRKKVVLVNNDSALYTMSFLL